MAPGGMVPQGFSSVRILSLTITPLRNLTVGLLHITETGRSRIRGISGSPRDERSGVVESSLIATHQRGAGVWIRRAAPAVS